MSNKINTSQVISDESIDDGPSAFDFLSDDEEEDKEEQVPSKQIQPTKTNTITPTKLSDDNQPKRRPSVSAFDFLIEAQEGESIEKINEITETVSKTPDIEDSNQKKVTSIVELDMSMTIEKRIAKIISRYTTALKVYWSRMKETSNEQDKLVKQNQKLKTSLIDYKRQLLKAETQQTEAIGAEEYDKAYEIHTLIQSLEKKISDINQNVVDDTNLGQTLQQKDAQQTETVMSSIRDSVSLLESLKKSQKIDMKELVNSETLATDKREKKVLHEISKIEKALKNACSELKQVENREKQINDSIKENTNELEKEKEERMKHLEFHEMELSDLMKKVKSKEREILECKTDITGVMGKISEARSTFDRQLKRIEDQHTLIINEREELVQKMHDRSEEKAQIAESRKQIELTEKQHVENMNLIEDHLSDMLGVAKRLQETEKRKLEWAEEDDRHQKKETTLKQSLNTSDRTLDSLRRKLTDQEKTISRNEQNITLYDAQIKSLDARKQVAVVKKNFKEAGKLSKEVKQMLANRTKSENIIKEVIVSAEKIKNEIKEANENRKKDEEEFDQVVVVIDTTRLRRLLQLEYELSTSLATIKENSSEKQLIDAQLEACIAETRDLRKKHGWPENFLTDEIERREEKVTEEDQYNSDEENEEDDIIETNKLIDDKNSDEKTNEEIDDSDNKSIQSEEQSEEDELDEID